MFVVLMCCEPDYVCTVTIYSVNDFGQGVIAQGHPGATALHVRSHSRERYADDSYSSVATFAL